MPKNPITFSHTDETAESDNLHHTLFDDVFKTICTYMLPLLIPVVNELFGTNYAMDKEEMERYAEEHMKLAESDDESPKVAKIISDTYIRLGNILYHVECQSTEDGDILIRILDYNMRIAFDNVAVDSGNGDLIVQLPHAILLMLRGGTANKTKKTERHIKYIYEEQKIKVPIQVMHVQAYTMEDIFKKKLYFLIPFYVLRYEKEFNRISENIENSIEKQEKYDTIYSELKRFSGLALEACNKKELSEYYLQTLAVLYRKVVKLVAYKFEEDRKERLVNTMDGQVLEIPWIKEMQKKFQEGRQAEMANTERERQRANDAEAKLSDATAYIKELEEKLRAQQNTTAGNTNTTNRLDTGTPD